jgi:DNA-binding response OmpR family regulator
MPAPHILIIEDDTTILELMAEYLREEGYAVTSALTGAEAVSRSDSARPDVILLDYGVGDKEGQSLAQVRRTAPWSSLPPIVLVSGHAQLGALAQAAGADGYVVKPFEIEDLLATIRRCMP